MPDNKFEKALSAIDEATQSIKNRSSQSSDSKVLWSRDGIILVDGMPGAKLGGLVKIEENDATGLVLQLDDDKAYAALLSGGEHVRPGNTASIQGDAAAIKVSDAFLGRVVNPLGETLDGLGKVTGEKLQLLEAVAPSVMDRKPVETPLQTGILAIDALVPVGRGQRELIIGDRQTGKTTLAIDTIINQRGQNVICIYVAIGQREGKLAQVIKTLEKERALPYTVVVSASSSEAAAMQYLAPYAGCAIGEYFMHQGKDVLIVYDDLSKHAVSYRELSLLLRKPPGREAYPGDVFYIHSRLLERAARLSDEKGGGSITALPIIETQAADISAYIPTNVISITDGQIFLEPKLFYKGMRPAINVGTSVSRVGGAAQTKIMKKVAGPTKLYLAQYADLAAFSQFASELDEESKKQLQRGERLMEVLKQSPNKPYKLWQQVLILAAATGGHLDKYQLADVKSQTQGLLDRAELDLKETIIQIEKKPEMTDEVKHAIEQFIAKVLA